MLAKPAEVEVSELVGLQPLGGRLSVATLEKNILLQGQCRRALGRQTGALTHRH